MNPESVTCPALAMTCVLPQFPPPESRNEGGVGPPGVHGETQGGGSAPGAGPPPVCRRRWLMCGLPGTASLLAPGAGAAPPRRGVGAATAGVQFSHFWRLEVQHPLAGPFQLSGESSLPALWPAAFLPALPVGGGSLSCFSPYKARSPSVRTWLASSLPPTALASGDGHVVWGAGRASEDEFEGYKHWALRRPRVHSMHAAPVLLSLKKKNLEHDDFICGCVMK